MKRLVILSVIFAAGCEDTNAARSPACVAEMQSLHQKFACLSYSELYNSDVRPVTVELLAYQLNKNAKSAYQFIGGSCSRYVPVRPEDIRELVSRC